MNSSAVPSSLCKSQQQVDDSGLGSRHPGYSRAHRISTAQGPISWLLPIPIRWHWPPLNSCGYRPAMAGVSPTRSNIASTRDLPRTASQRRLENLQRLGDGLAGRHCADSSWRADLEKRSAYRGAGRAAIARRMTTGPGRAISPKPSAVFARRRMARANVDFPDPDSPTSPTVSPANSSKLTSRTAAWAPNCTRK